METLDPDLEPPNPILLVNPWKPPRVTLFNTATYTHAIKLEGLECFKLWILHPKVTGHLTTSKTLVNMSSIPKDYHDFAGMFSKSKAGKLANHQLYDLKITLDKGTALPFGPIYSLSQEELFVSSLMRASLQGLFIHPTHSMELKLISSTRKMALFDFVSTSRASTRFQRKTYTHSHSSPISSMHHQGGGGGVVATS